MQCNETKNDDLAKSNQNQSKGRGFTLLKFPAAALTRKFLYSSNLPNHPATVRTIGPVPAPGLW